jgi:succinate dehydrogenase / fumarate reductase membrane anchor subunit
MGMSAVQGAASPHGGEHWMRERLTSAALLLLGLWLVMSLLLLPRFDRLTLTEWLQAPSGAVPMALLIVTGLILMKVSGS